MTKQISKTGQAGISFLSDIKYFSGLVLELPLYDYQLSPLYAILNSIFNQKGYEFLLVFSRQSGKNESAAHLLCYLLNLYQRAGCNIVYGAMGDGLGRGINRLEEKLNNKLNHGYWKKYTKPIRRTIGRAGVVFVSSHPLASARGETADILLIIDELQDQNRAHLEAVFTPMRAANNATAVYMGTVRTSHDALWLKKQELERLQESDGVQRVFMVGPDLVTADNPNYMRFLAHQEKKLGRHHPIVASEYYLEPLDVSGGLFPKRRLDLMRGNHGRKHNPDGISPVIALVDVGGIDEAATDPVKQLENPGRDYTICTIVEVQEEGIDRSYHAVDIFVDHGSKHFDGDNPLSKRLLNFITHWRVAHVVADKTGIGEGLTDYLSSMLGPNFVSGFSFNKYFKAKLGASFLSLVETRRFLYWQEEEEYSDCWWFFVQAYHCTYELAPGGQFDRDLRWGVPATAKVATPNGNVSVHDDRLISAALIAEADRLIKEGNILLGVAKSEIIPGEDPLDNLSF